MIIKKTFVTTSCLLFSAILLSSIYTQMNSRFVKKEIDFSAFRNLAGNVQHLSAPAVAETKPVNEDFNITKEIIISIDKEISKKIKKTRMALAAPKIKLEKTQVIAAVPASETTTDLSEYEINNKELITLYAFNVEKLEYSSFDESQIAFNYNDEVKDEVVTTLAASQSAPIEADEVKSIQPSLAKEDTKLAEDDMVMFDYSDKQIEDVPAVKTIDQKLYERPLSDTVKQAINREIGSAPIKKLQAANTHTELNIQNETPQKELPEIDLDSPDNIVYDYTNRQESKTERESLETSAFTAPVSTQQTQFIIRAKEINLNTQKYRQSHGFEFVPDYDRAERMDDQTSGEIKVEYSLSGDMNTQTGVLRSQGMIPTRVELNLGSSSGIEAPLIDEDGIQKFLQKKNLSIEGNLLMVAVDSNLVDVEIDSRFAERFNFDQNFKLAKTAGDTHYVLFAGVKTGNVLIKFLLANKETAQKIVYVGDGEMYFEAPMFTASGRDTYTFTSRTLLGQKKKELIINPDLISFFNTNITAKKKALNAYEMKIPTLVSGMRKYLEFKHLSDSVFVGSWNEKDIEVPSNEFINKVLEVAQVSSLKDRCVVQVNLSKDVRGMTANGKNRTGEMFVETSFLDKDGNFSAENSELAEKVFIVGDMEGLMNVKFDYTDGSSEFLKTFCSEGSYLVEQL